MADPTTSSTILTAQDLANINDALDRLDMADKELALAQRAGLNTVPGGQNLDALAQQSANARATLLKIKNTYFPNAT